MKKTDPYTLFILSILIYSMLLINPAFADWILFMPLPTTKQSFSYPPILSPVLSDDPSEAKPVGIGPLASGGDTLAVRLSFEQYKGPVDIYGAYTVSTEPDHVYVLNSDGSTFTQLTVSDINDALETGMPPQGALPWRIFNIIALDEVLLHVPVSSIPSGTYTVYVLVTNSDIGIFLGTPEGNLDIYFLWSTSFVIP